MNFNFSEDQKAIRDLAYQIFTDRTTDEWLLEFDKTSQSYDDELWATLAEQGLLALTIPEAQGGSGLGFIELCLMLEEQGRRLAPIPLYSTLVLGVLPLVEFGSDTLKNQYLPGVADGSIKFSAAIAEIGMSKALSKPVSSTINGDTATISGNVKMVPDGGVANAIIVPTYDANNTVIMVVVDSNAEGVNITPTRSARGEIQANISFDNVEAKVLGSAEKGADILEWIELHAQVALCAMQVGVTEEALKRTAEYTTERKQFGAPIGSLGMVAMQAADAYIDVESMRSTYFLALYRLSEGLEARAEVYAAKYLASENSHRIVHRTQHLHGGIGADVTYPIHRYFLWAKHIGVMIGGANVALSRLGELLAKDDELGTNFIKLS